MNQVSNPYRIVFAFLIAAFILALIFFEKRILAWYQVKFNSFTHVSGEYKVATNDEWFAAMERTDGEFIVSVSFQRAGGSETVIFNHYPETKRLSEDQYIENPIHLISGLQGYEVYPPGLDKFRSVIYFPEPNFVFQVKHSDVNVLNEFIEVNE